MDEQSILWVGLGVAVGGVLLFMNQGSPGGTTVVPAGSSGNNAASIQAATELEKTRITVGSQNLSTLVGAITSLESIKQQTEIAKLAADSQMKQIESQYAIQALNAQTQYKIAEAQANSQAKAAQAQADAQTTGGFFDLVGSVLGTVLNPVGSLFG